MILWLLNLLGGWYVLCGEGRDVVSFLNLCMQTCAPYWAYVRDETGFRVCMRRRVWRELAPRVEGAGICITVEHEGGLPRILRRYRRRWGLAVGLLLGCGLIWLSGQFVWRIEVRGTARYAPFDVLEELEAQGFGVGSYLPAVEVNPLQNRLLLASDRFSWISVNLLGTTAQVDVVERDAPKMTRRETAPANLIATADGQITRLELRDGASVVEVGDTVRAGQLLASGIAEMRDGGTRLMRAEGRVYATVVHHIRIEIPLAATERRYTAKRTVDRRIIFFGKTINLFKNTGIVGGSCDIIDNERIMSLFGRVRLPISLCTTTALPYVEEAVVRTPEVAQVLAEYALRTRLDALAADRELIRRTTATHCTDEAYVLDCTVWCVENIAACSPITLTRSTEASTP